MYTGVWRGAQVTGIAVMALSLTWISFTLRFYVRLGILKFIGREDWLMIAAMILLTMLCSLCLVAINYGLGAHMQNIPTPDKVIGFKYIFICELLYVVTTAVTKLSIGVYFLRLSSKRYQVWVIYTTLVVVMIFSTIGGEGKCLRSPILSNVTYAHAAMSAVTDWSFGILPIFFVRKMQMNPRTKLSVVLILSLGFFASSATIVRIFYIKSLTKTDDWSWEGINLVKWSMVEPAIAITASNIATLRPMFKSFFLFASKRFDTTIDEEERSSSESYNMKGRNFVLAQDYSVEFAEMLGLSRVGVTTEISAGGSQQERDHIRRRFGLSRRAFQERNESQAQLRNIPKLPEKADGVDWNAGIKTTTTITIDT
ncbi:hypothetical protein G7Y89_g4267 [Cudoniella acicularis]|uniref:Rhodopsin domain-containing protein n=1 Tax=Cudoniella acicularis TaxID=354080 RepID=A0A8H4RPU6_9HELO|nr:hypothetical protein G7Y89_g4267 [Cudoniella acicularis]